MTFTIDHLFAPLTLDEFVANYWQKEPVVLRDRKVSHSTLFTLDDIDDFIERTAPSGKEYDFFTAGTAVKRDAFCGHGDHVEIGKLFSLFDDGGTVHVTNVQKYWPPVGAFCRSVQKQLGCNFEADFWLTNANQFPAYYHYDGHDVFALQIFGSKRWRIWNTLTNVPRSNSGNNLDEQSLGEPIYEFDTKPGDLIYLPWGTPHAVTIREGYSLHLGFGIHPPTWADMIMNMLDRYDDQREGLGGYVPFAALRNEGDLEFAQESLVEMVKELASKEAVGDAFNVYRSKFLETVRTANDEHVRLQILGRSDLRSDTLVSLRQNLPMVWKVNDRTVSLQVPGGGTIEGPRQLAPAVRYIAESDGSFKIGSLPDTLDDRAKAYFVGMLIDRGLLTVTTPTVHTY